MSTAGDALIPVAEGALDSLAADPSHARRRLLLQALLIFALALAVRLIFFTLEVIHYPQPWSRSAPFGQAEMGSIAVNLAAGRGFSSPFGPGSTPTAWLCPLIPSLWALIIKFAGSASGFTARLAISIGAIPSAAAVVVYWLIALHLLRGRPAWRRASLLVIAFFTFWPESLYGIRDGWYYPWQELGTALVVLLGMRWIDRPRLKTLIPLALAGGTLALINVTPMPIFAVILFWPAIQNRPARRRMLGLGALGGGLALLIVSPWMIRDALVFHAFMPLRSVSGYQLFAGNNPEGNIRDCSTERHPLYEQEEMHRYQALGELAYSRDDMRIAKAYMRAHPLLTLRRVGERAYVIWFGDALDHWSWDGHTRYWQQGAAAIGRTLSSVLAAWGLTLLLLWAIASRRFANLSYKQLYFAIIFLIPLPFYLTIADYNYTALLRSWLLLLVLLAFSGAFRPPEQMPVCED